MLQKYLEIGEIFYNFAASKTGFSNHQLTFVLICCQEIGTR